MPDGQSRYKIAYVSDLDLRPSGGGSYAVNWHAHQQLQRQFDVTYCGPIVPRQSPIPKVVSKIRRRILHMPGEFTYFSPGTLEDNARRIRDCVPADADALFFRSATRWCRSRPAVPYFVYLDAVFHTFFENTFAERDFVREDIERIWREEAAFLEAADQVFFETAWGLERAKAAYHLEGSHYHAIGRGGVLEPPEADAWDGATQKLLTVAMNFRQKGGDIVREAFLELKPLYPALEWHIVGGQPDFDWQSVSGVHYEGPLRPDNSHESARLSELFADSFLLLHPTREDVTPLVITEAAYFGCPSISVNRFAIPELIENGVTGLLVDAPARPTELRAAVAHLIDHPAEYREMRTRAREKALGAFTWTRVGNLMNERMSTTLESARA